MLTFEIARLEGVLRLLLRVGDTNVPMLGIG